MNEIAQFKTEYPEWIENYWLDKARELTGHDSNSTVFRTLEPYVQALSDRYTRYRKSGVQYTNTPFEWAAYNLFFFPQTYSRTAYVIRELIQRKSTDILQKGPLTLLDLGCGTGAGFLAILLTMRDRMWHVTAVDVRKEPLNLLNELIQKARPHIKNLCEYNPHHTSALTFVDEALKENQSYNAILMTFSLNEIIARMTLSEILQWFSKLHKLLHEHGLLIIIEPAMKATTEALIKLRDHLIEKHEVYVHAPCPHQKPCPLRAEGKEWCHEVRRWNPPPSLGHLNRRLYRSIEVLKFSFLVLSPHPPVLTTGPSVFRLIAPVAKVKGKWNSRGCAGNGELYSIEWLQRDILPSKKKKLLELERGDLLCLNDSHAEKGSLRRLKDWKCWPVETS